MIQERELIQRAAQHDEQAFAELVRLHQDACYNLAYQFTQNEADAQELVQEVFLRVWRALPQFQMESAFSTWLYRLTNNAGIDFVRAAKRRKVVPLDPAWDPPDVAPGPETQAIAAERMRAVRRAMARLSPQQRLILTLRVMENLSYEQISQITGLRQGTVKSRLARAREKMRALLGNEFGFDSSNLVKGGSADGL